MVNIAMIGHKRIPSREGGIEIVVDELATRIMEKHKCIGGLQVLNLSSGYPGILFSMEHFR